MHVTKAEINPLHVPVQKFKKKNGKNSTLIHQEISFELRKLVSNTLFVYLVLPKITDV